VGCNGGEDYNYKLREGFSERKKEGKLM